MKRHLITGGLLTLILAISSCTSTNGKKYQNLSHLP